MNNRVFHLIEFLPDLANESAIREIRKHFLSKKSETMTSETMTPDFSSNGFNDEVQLRLPGLKYSSSEVVTSVMATKNSAMPI